MGTTWMSAEWHTRHGKVNRSRLLVREDLNLIAVATSCIEIREVNNEERRWRQKAMKKAMKKANTVKVSLTIRSASSWSVIGVLCLYTGVETSDAGYPYGVTGGQGAPLLCFGYVDWRHTVFEANTASDSNRSHCDLANIRIVFEIVLASPRSVVNTPALLDLIWWSE